MGLIYTITRPPLSDFVEFLWCSEGYAQPHAAERILPTGSMDLVLSLDEHGSARDAFAGARTQSCVLDTSAPLSMIGARFKPGGGFAFLDLPAGELQDLSVSPDTLWGWQAGALREQLFEARTAFARFQAFEQFLLQQLLRTRERHSVVRYAVDALGNRSTATSVADVVERTGLSSRRFIAVFRDEVGLTPKVFSRICRFRNVIGAVQSTQSLDWTAIALDCGYFDQAHFIHDFRAFAGMSPSAYLRNRTASPNHVAQREGISSP